MVLGGVGVGLVLYILRNPAVDRQTYTRLEQTLDAIIERGIPSADGQRNLEVGLQRIDRQQDIRLIVVSRGGDIVIDSRETEAAAVSLNIRPTVQIQRGIALDASKKAWLYVWRPLEGGVHLVGMAPRAGRVALLFSQRLREVFRDDLLPPLLQAGCAATILALILALWMTRWISAPLQRIVAATHSFSEGEYQEVPVGGPEEVKSLARSFNQMTGQVQASQQSQRDFVANVSHELKTPLTSIQGFAQAILDGTANSSEALQQAGEVIHAEAGRMHRLVRDLLDLARLDAGTANLDRKPVDLQILLANIVKQMSFQAGESQVDLIFSGEDVPTIIGDGDRLAQVFTNLVDNAIKHSPPGGKVDIQAYGVEVWVEIHVGDTGRGIPREDLTRVFERFYQVDKSRTRGAGRGSGLGLAIAKEIIQAHGGTIAAQNRPGQGSIFVVKIPLARPDDTTLAKRRTSDTKYGIRN